jgi:hypothetical protein
MDSIHLVSLVVAVALGLLRYVCSTSYLEVHHDANFIQGPKKLGNDINVDQRLLIDEHKTLWAKEDVRVWDEEEKKTFDLRSLVFITINDWPALSVF